MIKRIGWVSLGIFLGYLGIIQAQNTSMTTTKSGSSSGSGGITAGSAATGCTPSTNLWVDSGGLIQCGATSSPSATTRLNLATGAVGTPVIGPAAGGATFGLWFRASSAFTFNSPAGNPSVEINTNIIEQGSNGIISWSGTLNDATAAPDTQLVRVAANVFGPAAGSWFQNATGEGALNANYTNATTTFSNTNLSRTVISGKTYTFDLSLLISQSTAADGWKINFGGGSAAATNFVANCNSTAETGIIVTLANGTSAALATTINAATTVTTGGQLIECHGSFVPSGAGTFIIQAGLNSITTGTITIKRGSFLAMRDAPAL